MASSHRGTQMWPNSSGFSLVSILLATALVSILAMTTLHLVKLITTQSRYVANLEDLNNVTKQVTSILSIPDNCISLYSGVPVDLSNIGNTATPQLDVSAKAPFVGASVMSDLNSGRIKLLSLGLSLKQTLAGAGTDWYQGDAIVYADDPNDLGNFKARRIPVNFQFDAGNEVVACATAGISTIDLDSNTPVTGLPYGRCGPGQVMVGLNSGGVICSGGGNPLITSGTGCTGTGCDASDGGPCFGTGCTTNGSLCKGTGCTACGTCPTCAPPAPAASCNGTGCCAGPACGGC